MLLKKMKEKKKQLLVRLLFMVYCKGGPSDLGTKFYKITKKSCFCLKSLISFTHKPPVVENNPTTGEIRELLRPRSTPTGITFYFYMSSLLIHILALSRRKFQT